MDRILLVPVQASRTGALAVRTGRLPSGERVGLAFTSESAIAQTLGPAQQWIQLAAQALADLLTPLGVEQITVDPKEIRAAVSDPGRAVRGRGERLPRGDARRRMEPRS